MSNVTRLRHALPMSKDINKVLADLDIAIAKAVGAAKSAGLPHGIVVAILHGQAHAETARMVNS